MRENIATIPLIDAFKADGECPFCHLEREAEQHAISFILGSAYMEDDIREKNRYNRDSAVITLKMIVMIIGKPFSENALNF